MKPDELKHSAIFEALKKDKKVQRVALRLGKTEDWVVLRRFAARVKQTLMEASFEANNLEQIKRYKNLIEGMESIILLPGLVNFVREMEKEDKARKEEKEEEAKRRKFNPGAFVRPIVRKIRGIKE